MKKKNEYFSNMDKRLILEGSDQFAKVMKDLSNNYPDGDFFAVGACILISNIVAMIQHYVPEEEHDNFLDNLSDTIKLNLRDEK